MFNNARRLKTSGSRKRYKNSKQKPDRMNKYKRTNEMKELIVNSKSPTRDTLPGNQHQYRPKTTLMG